MRKRVRVSGKNKKLPGLHLRPDFPIVISGYTVKSHLGDYYKRATHRLTESLIKYDMQHIIYPLKSVDDWTTGCSLKPALILETLKAFKRPVLWIDADGEVFKYPKIFENAKFDIALRKVGGHWLSGTLYFSPKAIPLVTEWVKQTTTKEPDEITLLNICRKTTFGAKLKMLDKPYNQVVHSETDTSKIIIGHYIRPDVAGTRGVKAVKI